jgi:hypothetical protein
MRASPWNGSRVDLWIGAFLKREPMRRKGGPALHVYFCPLPTVVLHFVRLEQ